MTPGEGASMILAPGAAGSCNYRFCLTNSCRTLCCNLKLELNIATS